jgi:hypothetical protein
MCASGFFASEMNGHGREFRMAPDSFVCVQTIEHA